MAERYEKRYIIREISPDGLVKKPKTGSGWRTSEEDSTYVTKKEARQRIVDMELYGCVILETYTKVWYDENEVNDDDFVGWD